ncbi:MAG: type I secretion system permease/ATPase [Gammaproteobacteria bacterium]|nr:type I secretion system permease/ATPase [Gammaproteobacteria bacterium]
MDSGLQCLVIAAHLHQMAVDTAQLNHRYGGGGAGAQTATGSKASDVHCNGQHTGDAPVGATSRAPHPEAATPHAAPESPTDDGDTALLRAARFIGFKAKRLKLDPARLSPTVLPAIARLHSGGYCIIARVREDEAGTRHFLLQDPLAPNTEQITAAQLHERCAGHIILLRPHRWGVAATPSRFNLRWFTASMLKYRKLFGEVLVASFFLQLFALATPLFFQVVMDKVLVHRGFSTLNVLAFGFVVVACFDAVLGGLRNYLFSHTSNRVDVELGAKLFHHLCHLPLAYFENRQIGQTVARVRELENIRSFLTGTALTLLIDLFFTFVFFAVLWYYSPTLTLVVLGSLPFYIVLSMFITPVLRQRLDEKFRAGAINQAFLTETVGGMQTVKAQALEPQMQRRWEDQLADYVTASFRSQNVNNIASQCADFISKLTTVLIIWWGAHLVIAGALTVGQLVAFNMIASRITAPVLKLVQLWQDFQQAGISLQRLGDILNSPLERGSMGEQGSTHALSGALAFERVRFRYRPNAPLVLDELTFSASAGAVIGIVGRSGSGKSTVAKLLQGLYTPEAGRIVLDGIDLATVDKSWLRRSVGVVQQESFLFHRSVRDNIAVTNPALPFSSIVRCAQVAGAHDFILDLPEAYNTIIDEQGANLSGGQRQRIAIARALITNPRILVMDEATSALDYESERIVQENMGAIAQGRTVLVIAHRLSTVRHADTIVVIDKGRIAESGNHEQLLQADGYYARLFSYQNHSPAIRALEEPAARASGHSRAGNSPTTGQEHGR